MINDQQRGVLLLVRGALTGIKEPLPAGFSLDEAYTDALKQQIVPLLYYGAMNCGASAGLPAMQQMLLTTAKAISICEGQSQALAEICRCFEDNGIDYVLLKGAVLQTLYPEQGMRLMSDIDILIRMEQYPRIQELMAEMGFSEGKKSDHELPWNRNGVHIELHKRLIPSYNKDFYAYYGNGWQFVKAAAGTHRHEFSDEDQMVYLFTHFAKHYRDKGIGVKHLADLYVYRRKKPELDEAYIRRELKKLELEAFYLHVLETLSVWFDGAEPTEITDMITAVILMSGAYGDGRKGYYSYVIKHAKTPEERQKACRRRKFELIFLPYRDMCDKFPILKKAPVLLPFFWVVRGIIALFRPGKIKKMRRAMKSLNPEYAEDYQNSLQFVGLDYHFKD